MASAPTTIVRCEAFRIPLALREPFKIALQTTQVADNLFVRLTTADGRQGWGEASPLHAVTGETVGTCVAAVELLGPVLLGQAATEIQARVRDLRTRLPHNSAARSALDMALHDLAAQAAGLPLFRYLGGSPRTLTTDLTLGLGTPEATAEKARRAVTEMGFRHLKVKLGLDVERDVAAVAAVRQAVGPEVRLRLDANQGWGRQDAVAALARIAQYDVQYCEQPVPKDDVEGLAYVAERSPVPLMADEAVFTPADVLRIARLQRVPYVNLKVAKTGGIHDLLRADVVAETAGLASMVGCMMESRLGLTASAHAILACGSVRFVDLDTVFELADDPVIGGVRYEGDQISVPEAPGLGASLDSSALLGRCVLNLS
jgi:L-alanine-DL-glutamate epimerase-like enolase superfamily enzyme